MNGSGQPDSLLVRLSAQHWRATLTAKKLRENLRCSKSERRQPCRVLLLLLILLLCHPHRATLGGALLGRLLGYAPTRDCDTLERRSRRAAAAERKHANREQADGGDGGDDGHDDAHHHALGAVSGVCDGLLLIGGESG